MSEEIESLAEQMFRSVKGFLSKELADRDNRIAELELRIAAIPAGPKGDRGPEGPHGTPGIDGINGTHGINGRDGKDGIDGIDGLPGERGEKGELGLRGEQGIHGDRGDEGPSGKDGLTGDRGLQGDKGEQGLIGDKGYDGLPGKDGQDGVDGRDGKDGGPGRDALQIDPLPEIDPEKSYHRGTYAVHRGGLIRAMRTTDPCTDGLMEKAGWMTVFNGLHSLGVSQRNEREFFVVPTLTNGNSFGMVFKMPVNIWRGVWKQGAYEHGDSVTWDGSQWYAEKDTETKPGMPESDWKLCVKRGQNGKDGKDGEPGRAGHEGRAGKDLTQLGPNGQKF